MFYVYLFSRCLYHTVGMFFCLPQSVSPSLSAALCPRFVVLFVSVCLLMFLSVSSSVN